MRRSLRLHRVQVIPLLAFATVVGGCVLPLVPENLHEVPERSIAAIQPGISTRADVLLLLGNPTRREAEGAYFLYEWERLHGGAALGFPFTFALAHSDSCHLLAIQFASNALVSRVRVFHGEHQTCADLPGAMCAGVCARDKALRAQVDAWMVEATPVAR